LSQIENADFERNTKTTAEAITTAVVSEMDQAPMPGTKIGLDPVCPEKLENTAARRATPARPKMSNRFAKILNIDRNISFVLSARPRTLVTL
jgi:hypothetical protein